MNHLVRKISTCPKQHDLPRRHLEQGVALLEMIVVLPFLFLIFFSVFELGRLIQRDVGLTYFSREIAKTAFRECRSYLEEGAQLIPPDFTELNNCIQNRVVQDAKTTGEKMFPGVKIIVSAYEAPLDTTTNIRGATVLRSRFDASTSNDLGTHASKFSDAQIEDKHRDSIEALGVLMVAEMYIKHKVLFPGIVSFFNEDDGSLYAVAIS